MLDTLDSLPAWLFTAIDSNHFLTLESFYRDITRFFVYAFDTKNEKFLIKITNLIINSEEEVKSKKTTNLEIAEKELSSLNILAELGKTILNSIQSPIQPICNLKKYLDQFSKKILTFNLQEPHTVDEIVQTILALHREGSIDPLLEMFDCFAFLQNQLLKVIRQQRISSTGLEKLQNNLHRTLDSLNVLNKLILSSRISPGDSSPLLPKSAVSTAIALYL